MSSNLRILKTKRNNKHQSIRVRPDGPDKVECTIIESLTGRTLTSAIGLKSRKRSAQGNSKMAALHRLTRIKGRKWKITSDLDVFKNLSRFFQWVDGKNVIGDVIHDQIFKPTLIELKYKAQ